MRSGVEVPLLGRWEGLEEVVGFGVLGESEGGLLEFLGERGLARVVLRAIEVVVVSALGGGGREERSGVEVRMEVRQRKHSPVP